MTAVDYSVLDNSVGSTRSFYPQRHWTKTPESAVDYAVNVADGVQLSCRFHAVDRANPTVLFFYGNGETAAGYDHIAPHYNEIGANFFVADYRGYGASGGTPGFTTMLADAHVVLDGLREAMAELDVSGPVYVMGRSMGRHAAGELAVSAADRINGVIIESGRPNLGRFADGLEPAVIQALENDYHAKFYSIDIPALVIHGEWDELAPLQDAVDMHDKFKTRNKRLEIIPGAGHNDLMYVGYQQYFSAIRDFITRYAKRDEVAVDDTE